MEPYSTGTPYRYPMIANIEHRPVVAASACERLTRFSDSASSRTLTRQGKS